MLIIDPLLASVFRPWLQPGERILWAGRPDTTVFWDPAAPGVIALGFVWEVMATYASYRSYQSGREDVLAMTILLHLIGFYFILGRLYYREWRKKQLWYALTDKRALSLDVNYFGAEMTTIELAGLDSIRKSDSGNGLGSIGFGSHVGVEPIGGAIG